MKSSSFTVTTVAPSAVFLVDNNDNSKSVTNDAENVVSYVNSQFPNRRIFYKDTMGSWDELVHNNGTFIRFAGIAPVTLKKFELHFK
jgi:hypothetical protein